MLKNNFRNKKKMNKKLKNFEKKNHIQGFQINFLHHQMIFLKMI